MKNKVFFLFLLVFAACSTHYQVKEQSKQNIKIKGDSLGALDQTVTQMILPYKLALDSQMNVLVIEAAEDLKKDNPEGALGNMVCDVLMQYASKQNLQADFCVLNSGGLRIPLLYKGAVTVRTLFELMPFDNQLVLVKVSGSKCVELFSSIALANGTPVSGLRMEISNQLATQVSIGGEAFDVKKDYWILTSDYLANGGDKAEALLNPLERKDMQKLLRDVLIAQLTEMNARGENLKSTLDGRISKK
jgi:2',3'-cyclic-nucleotide 2'-phosphodiesterase (5'-nucleotidase family)